MGDMRSYACRWPGKQAREALMCRRLPRALQVLLLSVSMLATAMLLGVGPALGSPQAAGSGAGAGVPPVEVLRLQETAVFASPAPSAYRSGSRCDSDGNAFVQLASLAGAPAHVVPSSSVSEIIPDEKRILVYGEAQLSSSDYPNSMLQDFSVLPNGTLYALIVTRQDAPRRGSRPDPQYYIERFNDDGTSDSITPIQAPPGAAHWFADLLGVFLNGNFLIVGSSTASAERPDADSWGPFTAVYGPSGRFVSKVTLPGDVASKFDESRAGRPAASAEAAAQPSSAQASKPHQYFEVAITTGGIVDGPDGNVWMLRASDPIRLYAIDSGGRVAKHFEFSAPAPGLAPSGFGFANSVEIFFDFDHIAGSPSSPSGASSLLGVFDTLSSHFENLYSLPDTEKGFRNLACSDGKGGFLYLGDTPDRHLAVFDYAYR